MALSVKPSSRYSSYDSRSSTSSHFSDPSSSAELKCPVLASTAASRALAKPKPSDISRAKPQNLTAMVKNLMSKTKSGSGSSNKAMRLVIPQDTIAQDLKKTARKQGLGMGFNELPRKLFGVDKKENKKNKDVKALTDLKGNGNGNARTLAMVLRSERELLSSNKELEMEIAEFKLMLEQKNKEVEKLKDLCLSQREEIKSLKNAVLFPDVMNNQVQELLERQGLELKQAKQIIPALQRQVTSLTGQLQCIAEDLAEVKADKNSAGTPFQHHSSSPRTPVFDHEEAANSLEFSSADATAPGSPDDLFLKDLNPCLTPHSTKIKSKEFEALNYDSPSYDDDDMSNKKSQTFHGTGFKSYSKKLSKSSDCCQNSDTSSTMSRNGQRSDESKYTYRKPMRHRMF
ncbi:uncharacterized protein LOC116209591 [Punica granatum]|uniref:Uncharacterized protein LOC116209591 n=1 Tax=Punica granatum TaxID=22663 RepID=A0A6P8DXP1_PUNGR|nr:uncharacterized protein LOC116209591 [Punica granatum]